SPPMGTPPTMICRVEAMSEHSTGGLSPADHRPVNAASTREPQFVFGTFVDLMETLKS
ncbi:MAG: hypothetical protein QOF77_2145, partial [Solirubrobacteraceae bacterium]|nr:hypothetical protein [Solirubrobacteraceae bacterium]